tara:strand:+ start:751 stop:1137 length:387 start_codon:yes stop_codon:yes gene_type:complete
MSMTRPLRLEDPHRSSDELLMKISTHGPCILSGCVIYRKSDFAKVAKLRRSTLMSLLGSGLIKIEGSFIRLTSRAQYRITSGYRKVASEKYAKRAKDRGCVRKQIWVHPDDIERFEDFLRTLKGPMDD